MSELKPCPFCGGTPKVEKFYNIAAHTWDAAVECQECEASVCIYEWPDMDMAEQDVINKWNRRSYE